MSTESQKSIRHTSPAHTPGPWKLTEGGRIRQERIIGKYDDDICQMPFGSFDEAKEMSDSEIANGYLIAAAPDLLEAIKDAREYVEYLLTVEPFDHDDPDAMIRLFDTVIAKAEGQSGDVPAWLKKGMDVEERACQLCQKATGGRFCFNCGTYVCPDCVRAIGPGDENNGCSSCC